MKKILLIAAAVLGVALFSGCDNGIEPTVMRSKDITVYSNDWEMMVDKYGWNARLKADVPLSSITRRVCNSGAVMVYLVKDGIQELVPSVLWIDDWEGTIYGQAISCTFSPGWITFYYNTDDFLYPEGNGRPTLYFRVVTIE